MTCRYRALLLTFLALVFVVSEGVEDKLRFPRDVSWFEKSFLKEEKDKWDFFFFFFFVSLVRMIVNIIGASSCKPRGFRAFIYPFCSIDNQTKYKLLKLYTRQKAPCYYTSLFSRLFTTRMDFEVPIVFRNFWKSHCCCCQETSKKTFYSKCYMKVIPIFWLY